MQKKCKVCGAKVRRTYCSKDHRLLDKNRYAGETLLEALKRRGLAQGGFVVEHLIKHGEL